MNYYLGFIIYKRVIEMKQKPSSKLPEKRENIMQDFSILAALPSESRFGLFIERYLKLRGIPLNDAAAKLTITEDWMTKLVKGQIPLETIDTKFIIALADLLAIDPALLNILNEKNIWQDAVSGKNVLI